jgi:hypothetical protein
MEALMRIITRAALLPLVVLVSSSVRAANSDNFTNCDAQERPSHSASGLGSQSADLTGFSPQQIEVSCTAALADPRLLPEQTLRRIHLLRARAAARLEGNDPKSAIADLDLAETLAAPMANDRLYRRSLGLSLRLLRALALDAQGQGTQAVALARGATMLRPYSEDVQRVALHLMLANKTLPQTALLPDQIDRNWLSQEISLLAFEGNFATAAGLLPSGPSQGAETTAVNAPDNRGARPDIQSIVEQAQADRNAFFQPLLFAYIRAAGGNPAEARADVAAARAVLARTPRAVPEAVSASLPLALVEQLLSPLKPEQAEIFLARAEARILVAEGHPQEAVTRIKGVSLPADALTADLLTQTGAGTVPPTPSNDPRAVIRENLVRIAQIEPETPKDLTIYKRSRPNILAATVGAAFSLGTNLLSSIPKTDGFKSTENADGTVTVEFTGNSLSATLVREATLLRAAEVAIASGHDHFIVIRRNDYRRYWVTSQYGREIGRVPNGYKTDLTIRLPAADTPPDRRAVDARAIVQGLGPEFYQENGPKS